MKSGFWLMAQKIDGNIAGDNIDIEDYVLNHKDCNCFATGDAIFMSTNPLGLTTF